MIFFWSGALTPEQIRHVKYYPAIHEAAKIIKRENPDIILLQEIFDISKLKFVVKYFPSLLPHVSKKLRNISGKMDELKYLLGQLPKEYSNHASAYYWNTSFFPHPKGLMPIGIKESIISKYQISKATRFQLALLPIPILRQLYMKRALLEM